MQGAALSIRLQAFTLREGEAPAEPTYSAKPRLGRGLTLPASPERADFGLALEGRFISGAMPLQGLFDCGLQPIGHVRREVVGR